MECKEPSNIKNCTCTYASCSRRGVCCKCVAYHRQNDELPGCYFSKEAEKTYDRSISRLIRDKSR